MGKDLVDSNVFPIFVSVNQNDMVKNKILNSFLDVEVLYEFNYSDLFVFATSLKEAIEELKVMKAEAVYTGQYKKAVGYEQNLYFASTNLCTVEVAMMAKEHDACEFGTHETIWLN